MRFLSFFLMSMLALAPLGAQEDAAGATTASPPAVGQAPLPGAELRPIAIDPHGALEPFPWTVHAEEGLVVRGGPGTGYARLGILEHQTRVIGEYFLCVETDEEWLRIDYSGKSGWIARTGVFRPHPRNMENVQRCGNLPFGEEIVNRWWALPADYEPDDLVEIPDVYTTKSLRKNDRLYQLRREAAEQLARMLDAARADGVVMLAASPYRSWPSQKGIYDNAVQRSGMDQRYSAAPGHSEHQLGTTVDISYADRRDFLDANTPEHKWLAANAERFGFRQTYRADNLDETGYVEEPWHWRYMGSGKGEAVELPKTAADQ